jgi:hypothetical protein
MTKAHEMHRYVLVRSDQGDGGWSIHAPGSTDKDIAAGDAPYLVCGKARWNDITQTWSRPNLDDFRLAMTKHQKA